MKRLLTVPVCLALIVGLSSCDTPWFPEMEFYITCPPGGPQVAEVSAGNPAESWNPGYPLHFEATVAFWADDGDTVIEPAELSGSTSIADYQIPLNTTVGKGLQYAKTDTRWLVFTVDTEWFDGTNWVNQDSYQIPRQLTGCP